MIQPQWAENHLFILPYHWAIFIAFAFAFAMLMHLFIQSLKRCLCTGYNIRSLSGSDKYIYHGLSKQSLEGHNELYERREPSSHQHQRQQQMVSQKRSQASGVHANRPSVDALLNWVRSAHLTLIFPLISASLGSYDLKKSESSWL